MSQEWNEKIQMFSSHLEGTINQLCIHFQTLVPEGDMDNELKNQQFYGMNKTLQDRMCYLYDNSTVTYSQLMVEAWKAEGKATEASLGGTF